VIFVLLQIEQAAGEDQMLCSGYAFSSIAMHAICYCQMDFPNIAHSSFGADYHFPVSLFFKITTSR